MASTAPQPRIAIIGGGPGGLVLLRTLQYRGIPATLYERETSLLSRAHLGGSLDLGSESGQRALRENGLEEQWKKYSRPDGQQMKMCDSSGKILYQRDADEHTNPLDLRPEIDRKDLRKLLVEAVPADAIKWGYALSSVRSLEGGQHELMFANGFKTVCDILVGADGGNSRVRPLVSSVVPEYSGLTGAEVSLAPEVAARPDVKDLADLVGNGTMFAVQSNRFITCQRNSDGRIRVYVWFRGPADWVLPSDSPHAARQALLEKFEDWSPTMRKSIELCDDNRMYQRTLYQLPVGHRWDHVPGVTLVGDAAHLITPFAGAGANLAMVDGLDLGLVLVDAITGGKVVDEREAAVAVWEEKMCVEAGKIVAISVDNINNASDAPESMVEGARKFFEEPEWRRQA